MGFLWCYVLPLLGLILLWKLSIKAARWVYDMFIIKEKDLLSRYGEGSWALVTGSTDGIGLQFAHSLAKRGFNLVIVGRSEERIQIKIKEISTLYPKVQFRSLVADFANQDTVEFYQGIVEKLSDLDISLLVNNVGLLDIGAHHEAQPKKICDLVKVNCLAQPMLLNLYLSKLNKRSKKSGIIDLSSVMSIAPSPYVPIYTASKVFNEYLTRAIRDSGLYTNIDILCLRPSMTTSNMNGFAETSPAVASAEDCVENCLKGLGNVGMTFGARKHFIYVLITELGDYFFPAPWNETIRMKGIDWANNNLRWLFKNEQKQTDTKNK